jgi:AraC-like DNA-binding protein
MSAECRSDESAVCVAEAPPAIADDARPVVLRHMKTDESVDVGWHAHREGLMFTVLHGLTTMRTDSGTWTMLPRQIGWLPPETRHCGHSFGKAEALFLYLRADMCGGMPDQPRVLSMSPLAQALMERLQIRAGALTPGRITQLLAVLLDEVREAAEVPMHLPLPRDPRLLQMALALDAAPDNDTDLDGWALRLGMARRTLIRHFQQETGLSVGQWRQQLRLVKALEFLAEGESVTAAALSVGYSSVSAFIACFRQRFGVTPTKYFDRSFSEVQRQRSSRVRLPERAPLRLRA